MQGSLHIPMASLSSSVVEEDWEKEAEIGIK